MNQPGELKSKNNSLKGKHIKMLLKGNTKLAQMDDRRWRAGLHARTFTIQCCWGLGWLTASRTVQPRKCQQACRSWQYYFHSYIVLAVRSRKTLEYCCAAIIINALWWSMNKISGNWIFRYGFFSRIMYGFNCDVCYQFHAVSLADTLEINLILLQNLASSLFL